MTAYCGVDIGTTNCKAMLIDDVGNVLSRVTERTPRSNDGIGPCSDPEQIVRFVEDLVIRAAGQARTRAPLRSICVSGIGEDGVMVNSSGHPLGLAIPWFDRRANAEAESLQDVAAPFEIRTGIRIDGTRTAAKWLWLSRRAATRNTRTNWIALTDYPAFSWTGRSFMSETLAARTGCYDTSERRWIPELLTAAQAPTLPPIVVAGEVIGTISSGQLLATGLADRHTVVVAGGHDHPMAASVTLDFDGSSVLDSMGTAELVYAESTTTTPLAIAETQPRYLARSVRVGGAPGLAYLGVFEFSAILARYMNDDTACGTALRAIISGAPVPGEPGAHVPFYPDCESNAGKYASVIGGTDGAARAILEGCTMYTRRILDAIKEARQCDGPVFTTGGWTHSQSLLALRATVLGKPLHVVDEPQLAALGAARCGARAIDKNIVFTSNTSFTRTVRNDESLESHYSDLYVSYRARFDRRNARSEPSSIGKVS